MWWHLSPTSRAPYLGGFLDHYGAEMRVWLWAARKHRLDGILVWQADYWTSDAAYPNYPIQNPWIDPMSWAPEDRSEVGARGAWGNGSGRFLYPPNRDPERSRSPLLEAPIPSIRFELLRDGIEDFEYFWLLEHELQRARSLGVDPALCDRVAQLLEVPEDVYADPTHFATDPGPIHKHRRKLAEAIEELAALRSAPTEAAERTAGAAPAPEVAGRSGSL
jgi:hypothetical protein